MTLFGATKRRSTIRSGQVKPVTDTPLISFIKTGSGGSSGYVKPAEQPSDESVLDGFVRTLYGVYKPQPIVYRQQSAETLMQQISAWLRPGYESAIRARQEQTKTSRAELDADAISRGMGASSFVSDVKARQTEAEARDVAALESEYGATLAQTLGEQLAAERERALETDMFNRGNEQEAYLRAYDAALAMFAEYKKKSGRRGGYGGGGGSGSGATATSPENCAAFLSGLSPEERAAVYGGTTAEGRQYKAELLASVSLADYYRLMQQYPPQ